MVLLNDPLLERHRVPSPGPADAPLGRRFAILNYVAVGAMALLTLASYFCLDRALEAHRASSVAIRLAEQRSMLSQRIASLVGQYALGSSDARSDIRGAVDAFENTGRLILGGDASSGLRPAGTATALNAAVADFLLRARRIAALPPHDARLAGAAAAIFSAARKPLIDQLESAVGALETRAEHGRSLLRVLGLVTATALLGTLLAAVFGIVRPTVRRATQFAHEAGELARVAPTDPLTGLLNARGFQARGEVEIHKAKRYARPLSLLVIGPDHLEAVVKAHGAQGGDSVLKTLAAALFNGTRTTDIVGRLSADEFAVLLPETNCPGAELVAERLHRKISSLATPIDDSVTTCTVSIGVSTAEQDAVFLAPTCQRAKEALYEAQMRGRNRVYVNAP